MTSNNEPDLFPDIGLLRHIWHTVRDSSSRLTKILGFSLIIGLCIQFGLRYVGHPSEWEYLIDRVFVLGMFLAFVIGTVVREFMVSRKERYANIFGSVEAIHSRIRDLSSYLNSNKARETVRADCEQFNSNVVSELEFVLDEIAGLFAMLTGTSCRTAIKATTVDKRVGNGPRRIYLYALARDRRSASICARNDRKRLESDHDLLEDNVEFHSIFDGHRKYVINNDLINLRPYANSSFRLYDHRPPPTANAISRWLGSGSWAWPLPYRSRMVFPIHQPELRKLAVQAAAPIAFLTIDSAFRNVWKERFDGPLGASLADALFFPLNQYRALLSNSNSSGNNP